jgi:hypothetical protein
MERRKASAFRQTRITPHGVDYRLRLSALRPLARGKLTTPRAQMRRENDYVRVIAGLGPAIPLGKAPPCRMKRDGRDKPGDDKETLFDK